MDPLLAQNVCPKCKSAIPADAPGGLCPKCLMEFVAFGTGSHGATAFPSDRAVPDIEAVRAAFPQLEIIELVGQGGMGAVYKARQPKLDRIVALKILPQSLACEPAFTERFQREGRLLARLNHSNIVGVYDFGQQADMYYLVMEYVDGINLRQAYATARFTPEQALAIIPKICEALQFAHDDGVLHRDIKPENILLDTRGRVKIADFGIAKFAGADERTGLTATGATIGTPHYMAPEQIERPADVDHRADIYSLGVVFYEMLTGELPLGRFASPSERTAVDARVDKVVLRALEKDRERRQQSADEVRTEVQSLRSPPVAKVQCAPAHSDSLNSASGEEPPVTMAGRVWRIRAITSLIFVLASILFPLFAFFEPRSFNKSSFFQLMTIVGVFALWLGVPGTWLGWNHLRNIRRSGDRRGMLAALPAATAWPILIIAVASMNVLVAIYSGLFPESHWLSLDTAAVVLFMVMGMLATYYCMKGACQWASCSSMDTTFAPRYRASVWTFPPAFFAITVVYCLFGIGVVAILEKSAAPKQQVFTVAQIGQHPFELEIISATSIENVLILKLQCEEFRQSSFRIDYTGPALTPQASILATTNFDGICVFPDEPGVTFQPQANRSFIEIAFALPSADAALACRNKVMRLNKSPMVEQNGLFHLFEITAYGRYSAFLVRGVRASTFSPPMTLESNTTPSSRDSLMYGLRVSVAERTIRLAYLIPDGNGQYKVLNSPVGPIEYEIEREGLDFLLNQLPRGTLVTVVEQESADKDLVESVYAVIDRWRESEASPVEAANKKK